MSNDLRTRRGALLPTFAGLAGAALFLAACGPSNETEEQETDQAPQAERTVAEPDLSQCPDREPADPELRQRTEPIAVPSSLRPLMRSDMNNFAVGTSEGATVCIDASWMEQIDNAQLSDDKRFLEFDWSGYEAFGHVIVDRSGSGQVVDTGVPPVRSPSGERLAAADFSESGYGALDALGVWDVEPNRLTQVATIEERPQGVDWRIDRWVGEDCLELSAIAFEDAPQDWRERDEAPRQRYFASSRAGGWDLRPGRCPAE